MILIMMNTKLSECPPGLREEMDELKVSNLRYWAKGQHTALEKAAHALRQTRLRGIKQELSDMKPRAWTI
jgi:hypothetical protein